VGTRSARRVRCRAVRRRLLELADALDRDPDARHSFDALSHSGKQRIVTPIEDAKTAETRQRRIVKAITTLRTGSI
jgi:uncharacterized protein YdeI (YjbR/CyaY-like superfamily)